MATKVPSQKKKIIREKMTIRIAENSYSPEPFTIGMIRNCEELLDSDILKKLDNRSDEITTGWGFDRDETRYDSYKVAIIEREREETDEELVERLKSDHARKSKEKEERKLLYLELKAEFEP